MEDRRITRTKETLRATLKEMLKEMPLGQIRVTEICKRSHISRITFYTYYSDKEALLNVLMTSSNDIRLI